MTFVSEVLTFGSVIILMTMLLYTVVGIPVMRMIY